MNYGRSEQIDNDNKQSFAGEHKNLANKSGDISENSIREHMPEILNILLIDRTKSTSKVNKNIIWANENYRSKGFKAYAPTAEIQPNLITGSRGHLIMPRSLKAKSIQKERTKFNAEVFTPLRVVKEQNDLVEKAYLNDDLKTYVNRTWLEVTCGEAPYMVSRYDMETAEIIPLSDRVGFLDRKLARINKEVCDKNKWQYYVELSFKASYGFEWNGDSLLIARENLLYTYRDYYIEKWEEEPDYELFLKIAGIISYNVFQMDGIAKNQGLPIKKKYGPYYILPLSEEKEKKLEMQMSFDSLFEEEEPKIEEYVLVPGKRVKIMNWETNKMEYFDEGVN